MFKFLEKRDGSLPTEINNPFNIENIEEVHMHCTKYLFSDSFHIWGSVVFKNGNTQGKQEFNADSLGDLYMKIYNFCERLSNRV